MTALKLLWIVPTVVVGVVLFWLFPLKLLSRLMDRLGMSAPCPAALAALVDNPVRRRYMREIVDRVGIRRGETVLELGPGPGAFTVDAAQRVGPHGRLIAVDIQPKMIAMVERRARANGLRNVEARVASAYHLPLEPESVDRAFLVTVLPEIPDQDRALQELRRVLKPGGLLSITEEFYDPDYRCPSETVRRVQAAGFGLEERFGTVWVYTCNFRKAA
jgi:ubiquinone/menaquinone biosynthesis C-methylase UbiE